MTDFITSSIAEFMERFVGELLDIDLSNRALGQVTGPEIAQVRQFLQDLLTNNRIKAYGVDEFGANTATNIAAGEWRILIEVTTISAQERIVLMATIGETVTVSIVNP